MQRQQIGQVECGYEGTADICVSVARQTAQPGFQGIHGLYAAAKALRLDQTAQLARLVLKAIHIFVHNDDRGRQVARSHIAGLYLGFGRLRIFAHEQSITIYFRVGIVEKLIHESQHALVPALDEAGDLLFRVILVKADKPCGIAQLERQTVQSCEHGRPGLLRKAINGNDSQMFFLKPVFKARDQTADKVPTAQQGIKVHGHRGHTHRLKHAGDAELQVSQQV